MLKWIIVTLILIGGGVWLMSGRSQLPGEAVADQGREHWEHAKLDEFKYNSNPPVSGPHDADWIRPGIYGEAQDKYKLIHSLEHGYVVVHYNCALPISKSQLPILNQFSMIQSIKAHKDPGDSDGDRATPSAGSRVDCSLGQTVADWDKKIGLKRIIIQPNPEIDKLVILAAWGRILQLDIWNEKEATRFAKAYHNRGPEQTME